MENEITTTGSETIEFSTSILTFYIKGSVKIASDHVHLTVPNTVLGLIPYGSTSGTYDVSHIGSVQKYSHLTHKRLIVGIILVMFIFMSNPTFINFVAFLIGVLSILNSFENGVLMVLDSGQVVDIPLIVFEKDKAALIEEKITSIIHSRTYDTNTRIHATNAANTVVESNVSNTDRIIDAIKSSSK